MGLDWGVCCAVGSFFVLFSPVTVTEVWVVGRGSVLRARARASKQDGCTAKRIPPGSGDGEENLSPERLASPNTTASINQRPEGRTLIARTSVFGSSRQTDRVKYTFFPGTRQGSRSGADVWNDASRDS